MLSQGGRLPVTSKKKKQLLRPEERKILHNIDGRERAIVLLQWCGGVLKHGHAAVKAPANVLKSLADKVIQTRFIQDDIVDTIDLPVPLQYFHILCVMVSTNLFLWAYLMGVTQAISGTFVFVFCGVIFVGMVELANSMTNPFGEGDVDFPVDLWLARTYNTTATMFDYSRPGGQTDSDAMTALVKYEPKFQRLDEVVGAQEYWTSSAHKQIGLIVERKLDSEADVDFGYEPLVREGGDVKHGQSDDSGDDGDD